MKNIIITVCAVLLCSCHVHQETDIEINPRPSLVLGYEYVNDAGINTLPQEVRKLNIAVVNSDGETVSRADILRNQMDSYRPLYGVPEGRYTVVTFGNADSSRIVNGSAMLDATKAHTSTDELFHKIERYDVRRGVAKLRTISLNKLYYAMTLRIVGLRGLVGKSVTDFSVAIDGTPSGFASDGKPLPPMTIVPRLKQVADTVYASFNLHRFSNAANISLALKHKAENLIKFPLSEYLQDTKADVDLLNDKDVTIPIELDVTTAGVSITIGDWLAATTQWESVGN